MTIPCDRTAAFGRDELTGQPIGAGPNPREYWLQSAGGLLVGGVFRSAAAARAFARWNKLAAGWQVINPN